MNARIKELIKECSSTYTSYFDGRGNVTDTHFDKEKFAELIVKECGVALSPMLRDMISRGQAYDLIKQHFGVE